MRKTRARGSARGVGALAAGLMLGLLALSGCGGGGGALPPRSASMATEAPARDAAALAAALDAYYTAPDVAGLESAVAEAARVGDGTAQYHEIAADLALLSGRDADAFEHLVAAVLDPAGDAPEVALVRLEDMRWTLAQRARVEALLDTVRAAHPDPEVRARAAWMAAQSAHLRADAAGRDAALSELGFRPRFAVIGPWDNEQGKRFDAALPPEKGVDLSAEYTGSVMRVGWRVDYVMDPRGIVDFGAIVHPTQWQVAYAAAGIVADQAGAYELRLGTSGPVKVWINDAVVFEGRRVGSWLFDGLVIPVTLAAGPNRVLIKSAHQTGPWTLAARVTGPGGALVQGLRTAPADVAGPPTAPAGVGELEESILTARFGNIEPESARRAYLLGYWAGVVGLRARQADLAERFVARWPESLRGRLGLARALWSNEELGRTADLLNDLNARFGEALPLIAVAQARFWRQQNLETKAREIMRATAARHPDRPQVGLQFARLLGDERWHEERCAVLEEVNRRWPAWPEAMFELGDCLENLGFHHQAARLYERVMAATPASPTALERLHWIHLKHGDDARAVGFAERLTTWWPHRRQSWEQLGEARRRAGDTTGAADAWQRLTDIAPTSGDGFQRLARLALHAGDRERALHLWREALLRDPDNLALANRVSWLDPTREGPWIVDVPDEEALIAAVRAREGMVASPGTDVVYLLDDEVTALAGDGSSINVVTMVAHAVNVAGRDQLTRMTIRGGGRHRLLHAFAVDPAGRRNEAASIRQRTVRFRDLSVGSTVVFQYRIDSKPDGYLAGYMARQWWFQAPAVQTRISRWVLWAPSDVQLHEEVVGPAIEREDEQVEGLRRVSWTRRDTPSVVMEPAMPPLGDVASNITVSTVPAWETYWKWEEALLRDAFRESPEVHALASQLFAGTDDPQEKIWRIHEYIITNIRYQQDYERPIAGVKPHAAPVTLSRKYGDCKDKAVLFITLARLAGIDVHFALVRTRDAGEVRRGVPMQQFNHAIVYVPAQAGIAEARFYDPTVDALDVEVLRHDDQGTWSLVFDTRSGVHTWREIPFQAVEMDYTTSDTRLSMDLDGGATGTSEITARGWIAERLRQQSRNPEKFTQMLDGLIGTGYPGGRRLGHEVLQLTDLREPARLRVSLLATQLGRREGSELRARFPGHSRGTQFSLGERRHPQLLGTRRTMRWRTALELPAGAKVKRLPGDGVVEAPCFRLQRTVRQEAGVVIGEHELVFRCERIEPAQYNEHREREQEMLKLLAEEVVLAVRTPKR